MVEPAVHLGNFYFGQKVSLKNTSDVPHSMREIALSPIDYQLSELTSAHTGDNLLTQKDHAITVSADITHIKHLTSSE